MLQHKGFSASRVGELLAQGTGKTRLNYIFEIAEEHVGAKKDILTRAMSHGIVNEVYAINLLIANVGGQVNEDGHGEQISFKVNDFLTAKPDGFKTDHFTLESKCQYYIHTFFEQIDKLPLKYYYQVQTQMMALKVDKGYLIDYLTKPEEFGQDDWQEYPIPLEQRYHIHEIEQDIEVQDRINEYSAKYYPYIGMGIEMLSYATVLSHDEFFGRQFKDRIRFQKLKDVNWTENLKEVYRYDNSFYIQKK